MPANYVLLERIELNASATSVTFSNIPQSGYTDLKVVFSARSTSGGAEAAIIEFNGSTTSFSSRRLNGEGTGVTSDTLTNIRAAIDTAANTVSTFSNSEFYVPNYLSSNYKSVSFDSVMENNATAAVASLVAGLWSNTAAINSIKLSLNSGGSFVQYSTFSLYGLAAVGTTPVIAPKASGGNITTDGTYWIHTFNSTGAFVPSKALSCDVLVVAGGGSGSPGNSSGIVGGGGGAGGFRTATNLSISSSTTITVGAGGANQTTYNNAGNKGSDSVCSTITSSGGGGGNPYNTTTAQANGGSGGGAMRSPNKGTGNLGGYSPSEGNNGGTGANNNAAGGGGGASAVGVDGGSDIAGAGGAGTSNSYSGTAVTYAGGGGGSGNTLGAGGAGGGGAGALRSGTPAAVAGTANTGGGGGGGSISTTVANYQGAAGGSGIVIIRYTIA